MGRFYQLKLLTVMLMVHYDVELASCQCKSDYCSNQQKTTSQGKVTKLVLD